MEKLCHWQTDDDPVNNQPLYCATICNAAAQVMSMGGELSEQLCQLCDNICSSCARECEDHPEMQHCRDCAAACRHYTDVCAHMTQHT